MISLNATETKGSFMHSKNRFDIISAFKGKMHTQCSFKFNNQICLLKTTRELITNNTLSKIATKLFHS